MAEHDLYGILEGAHPQPPLPQLRMVVQDGLTAVLGAQPRPLMRLPQSRKAQLLALSERLRAQEACMPLGAFLPASPLAHLSPQTAAVFLDANRPFLFDQIARFAGLVQYQLQIAWTEDQVLTRFRDAPEIAPLFTRPLVAADITLAVSRLAENLGARIVDHLAPALEILTLPLAPGLLWNGALLLPRAVEAELEQALQRIDAIWTEGLTLRLTGPAPVMSFCTLDLEQVTAPQIDWALDRFGLASLDQAHEVAAIRRRLLIASGGADLEEIDFQARVIEAAARLEGERGFALCRARSEGQALAAPLVREVA